MTGAPASYRPALVMPRGRQPRGGHDPPACLSDGPLGVGLRVGPNVAAVTRSTALPPLRPAMPALRCTRAVLCPRASTFGPHGGSDHDHGSLSASSHHRGG